MSIKRLLASAALGASLSLSMVAAPPMAFAANPSSGAPPTVPQVASATSGASWLSDRLNPAGFVPSSGNPAQADLSATANTVLALASVGDDAAADHALSYLAGNVNAFVTAGGSDGPGQLALLILGAHALGANPESFGGVDLVSRLLATEQPSGADAGLFGAQDATFDGAYRQGLALSALASVGMTTSAPVETAVSWLKGQQCPDGGWTSLITSNNPCNGDPANFEGPDTNSTAQAIEGLSAQGALPSKSAHLAARFIAAAQDPDGGWGFEPNTASAPSSSDPDSTALMIQALLALGKSPSSATYARGSANPVAALMSFQLTSGAGSGAFFFPGDLSPNTVATYQAVPALAGTTDPFDLVITTMSLPGTTLHSEYVTTLAASGGTAPYTWKPINGTGALPAGLKLNRSSGAISGRTKGFGTSTFAVEVFAARAGTSPTTQAIAWRVFSITSSAS